MLLQTYLRAFKVNAAGNANLARGGVNIERSAAEADEGVADEAVIAAVPVVGLDKNDRLALPRILRDAAWGGVE